MLIDDTPYSPPPDWSPPPPTVYNDNPPPPYSPPPDWYPPDNSPQGFQPDYNAPASLPLTTNTNLMSISPDYQNFINSRATLPLPPSTPKQSWNGVQPNTNLMYISPEYRNFINTFDPSRPTVYNDNPPPPYTPTRSSPNNFSGTGVGGSGAIGGGWMNVGGGRGNPSSGGFGSGTNMGGQGVGAPGGGGAVMPPTRGLGGINALNNTDLSTLEIPDELWQYIPEQMRAGFGGQLMNWLGRMGFKGMGNVGRFGERSYLRPQGQTGSIWFDPKLFEVFNDPETARITQWLLGERGFTDRIPAPEGTPTITPPPTTA